MEDFKTLRDIKALNLFFYNYKDEDIRFLKEKSSDFKYWWLNTLDKETATFPKFWDAWASADLDYKTQMVILERALERYGNEAERSVSSALKYSNITFQ